MTVNNPTFDHSTLLSNDVIQITPESIETEFKNILDIHKHSVSYVPSISQEFRSDPISHSTHLNGSFPKTVLFRENDDTYVPFEHTTVLISPVNLTQFWEIYESYKHNYNIILDSRLQILIMYATLAYSDELIVYNSYTLKVINLYDYCSEMFKISAAELNIRQIQELFIMKMVISYFLYDCEIVWQVNQIISNLKDLHNYSIGINRRTIIDIMMNYIRCSSIDSVNRSHVIKLYGLFYKFFSHEAFKLSPESTNGEPRMRYDEDLILSKWKINGLTLEEVYVVFMLLKQSNFTFIKNDSM